MFKILLSLILLASLKAKADCKTIHLLGDAWPTLPTLQESNMCFASLASDLLGSESKTRVSIVAIANRTERSKDGFHEKLRAIQYGIREGYHRFHYFGEILPDAIKVNLEKGLCKFSFLDTLPVEDIFTELEKIRETRPQNLLAAMKFDFDSRAPSFAEKLYQASSKGVPLIDLAIDLSCVPIESAKSVVHHVNLVVGSSEEQASQQLDQVLASGHAIGVGYDFVVMKQNQTPMKERAYHASTLFGQRWNQEKGQCEYLIRLTDQKSCEYISKPYLCKNGIVAVPKKDFLEAVSDMTWLENL